jgi:hypothetical protein
MSLTKKNWYATLIRNPDDMSPVSEVYDYYTEQYDEGLIEATKMTRRGANIADAGLRLPGISVYRYNQLQEIEQIMLFLQNQEKRMLGQKRRLFREHYNRELSDSMVEKYADTDPELLDLMEIRNMLALVRNKFLGLTKQHELLHFQILAHLKLRDKEIEGVTVE